MTGLLPADHKDPDVALILAAYASFARGDIDAAVAGLHPQVEWIEPEEFPGGGRRTGRAAVAGYLRDSRSRWARLSSEPTPYRRGDDIVIIHRVHGTLVDGTSHDAVVADVYAVSGGQVVRMKAYADPAQVEAEPQVDRTIRTVDDVLCMLDRLFAPGADRWTEGAATWWDRFYADRGKQVPFFAEAPDENLVSYLDRGIVAPGRALDLGCGPGRNAVHLARAGFEVDAIDLSATAISWGRERARAAGAAVRFHCGSIFTAELPPGRYGLVYDSGCLHHLPPHRRVSYLSLLDRVLAPGGHFGLTCFAAGAMGSEVSDEQFYRQGGLHGGLAYTPAALRWIFSDLTEVEQRPMRDQPAGAPAFGVPFLLTALFRRAPAG